MPLSSYGFNFTAIHVCLVAVASVEDNDRITMLNGAVLYEMQLETCWKPFMMALRVTFSLARQRK